VLIMSSFTETTLFVERTSFSPFTISDGEELELVYPNSPGIFFVQVMPGSSTTCSFTLLVLLKHSNKLANLFEELGQNHLPYGASLSQPSEFRISLELLFITQSISSSTLYFPLLTLVTPLMMHEISMLPGPPFAFCRTWFGSQGSNAR